METTNLEDLAVTGEIMGMCEIYPIMWDVPSQIMGMCEKDT